MYAVLKEPFRDLLFHDIRIDDFEIVLTKQDIWLTNNPDELYGIPFKLPNVPGAFIAVDSRMESLCNCPDEVQGAFVCGSLYLRSLFGIPKVMQNCEILEINRELTYRNIHKQVNVADSVTLPHHPRPGILNWLLIPSIQSIHFHDYSLEPNPDPKIYGWRSGDKDPRQIFTDGDRHLIESILNRHIHTKDILTAQEELIDAGFARWARL